MDSFLKIKLMGECELKNEIENSNPATLTSAKKLRCDIALAVLCELIRSEKRMAIVSNTVELAFNYADEFIKILEKDNNTSISDLMNELEEKTNKLFSEETTN